MFSGSILAPVPWAVLGEELCLGINLLFPCSLPFASQGKGLHSPQERDGADFAPWLNASPYCFPVPKAGSSDKGRSPELTALQSSW